MFRPACLVVGVVGLACGSAVPSEDVGVGFDAGRLDAPGLDAGSLDALDPLDAALLDADAAPLDAGGLDAGPPDAEPPDASPPGIAPELYRFLAGQQADSGVLESFVAHPGLPADFRGYLAAARPVFVYDVSLAILAWLGRGEPDDLARARRALDALVTAIGAEGRVPDTIHGQTLEPSPSSSTGNATWVMLALLTARDRLGDEAWLLAAERIAAFLLSPGAGLQEPRGFGGIRLTPGSTVRSTEHNLDAYPAFTRLASFLPTSAGLLTPEQASAAAAGARIFAESQFDPRTGAVGAGSTDLLLTSNETTTPLDTQSWSVLSLGRGKWRAAYDWARQSPPAGLWLTSERCGAEPARGPPFSSADVSDVWTEGLGQMQAAAQQLALGADAAEIASTIDRLRRSAPNADQLGLVATCSQIDTGFGFSYFNSLHVGATAWAAIAAVELNPYWGTSTQGGLPDHPASGLPWVRVEVPANDRFTCERYQPCPFVVRGTSDGLASGRHELWLWVRPLEVPGLPYFRQRDRAVLGRSGTWQVRGALGSAEAGGVAGERLEVVMTIVEAGTSLPTSSESLNPSAIPGLVSISGRLSARVQ